MVLWFPVLNKVYEVLMRLSLSILTIKPYNKQDGYACVHFMDVSTESWRPEANFSGTYRHQVMSIWVSIWLVMGFRPKLPVLLTQTELRDCSTMPGFSLFLSLSLNFMKSRFGRNQASHVQKLNAQSSLFKCKKLVDRDCLLYYKKNRSTHWSIHSKWH